jgi:hypothetical protein
VTGSKGVFMDKELAIIQSGLIETRIFTIQNKQVMIDRDLAELYNIETKALNQAVKRNVERFPKQFCFQLSDSETKELVANCDRFKALKHSASNPYAFTEQGVAMLSAVLRSETAVKVSIEIMNAFVQMRHYLQENANIIGQISVLKNEVHSKFEKYDENFNKIFHSLEQHPKTQTQGIFFQGQIFDAYAFFQNIIQKAKKEIILIDGYVDLTVLEQFSKKKSGVQVTIYTDSKTKISALDVQKFNSQYPQLNLNYTSKMHDRFLIIDNKTVYHIGASLKDLSKKCFAFELMEDSAVLIQLILKNL